MDSMKSAIMAYIFSKKSMDLKKSQKHIIPAINKIMVSIFWLYFKGEIVRLRNFQNFANVSENVSEMGQFKRYFLKTYIRCQTPSQSTSAGWDCLRFSFAGDRYILANTAIVWHIRGPISYSI